MQIHKIVTGMLCTGILLAGCDSDPTAATGDTLTQEEAAALGFAIITQGQSLGLQAVSDASSPGGPQAPSQAPIEIDDTGSLLAECAGGGTASVNWDVDGAYDDETGAGTVDFVLETAHDGCTVLDPETSQEFVISGDPSLAADFSMTADTESNFEMLGTYNGSIAWASDGREGTCLIGLAFELSVVNEVSMDATLTGSVCGVSVAREFSISTVT